MFGRVVEVMLGCWLLVSPFVFGHPDDRVAWWVNDLACGVLVIVLALLSFSRRLRYAHVVTLLVGVWLVGYGWAAGGHPSPPATQNAMLVGMLLMMFALVPNQAHLPPQRWRDYYAARTGGRVPTP